MPKTRPERIERRAERVMGRAKKNYGKYEALRKSVGDREMTMNEMGQSEKLERRVARQETRAKSLKNKAEYLKDKKSPKTKATIKRIDKKMSRPMQTPAEKMSNTPKPNATMRTPRKK